MLRQIINIETKVFSTNTEIHVSAKTVRYSQQKTKNLQYSAKH